MNRILHRFSWLLLYQKSNVFLLVLFATNLMIKKQKLTFFWFFLHFRNLWRSASFPFPFGCRSRMFNNLNFSIRYIRFTRKFVIRLEWVNIVEILWCRGRRLVLISIFVWFWARWIFFKFTVDNVTTIFLCLYFLLFLFFRRILEKANFKN